MTKCAADEPRFSGVTVHVHRSVTHSEIRELSKATIEMLTSRIAMLGESVEDGAVATCAEECKHCGFLHSKHSLTESQCRGRCAWLSGIGKKLDNCKTCSPPPVSRKCQARFIEQFTENGIIQTRYSTAECNNSAADGLCALHINWTRRN